MKIEETTALEPDVLEHKYYCAGVGNTLVEDGDETMELTAYALE